MAQPLKPPAPGVMTEKQLARDSLAAWLSPEEQARVRAICGTCPTPVTKTRLRDEFNAGSTWWSLLSRGGEGDMAWPPQDPEAVTAQALGSVRNRRRRQAVRGWADAHGVPRYDAAAKFGIGWC